MCRPAGTTLEGCTPMNCPIPSMTNNFSAFMLVQDECNTLCVQTLINVRIPALHAGYTTASAPTANTEPSVSTQALLHHTLTQMCI